MKFELSNEQRVFFGLEPIKSHWERVLLKGDTYREDSIIYFEGDVIKRHIVSTDEQYKENQYDELTRSRSVLLPKTGKGKEKKLTASVLESRKPSGIFCLIESYGRICISNSNSQTTFYDNWWQHRLKPSIKPIVEWVDEFIKTSPVNYLPDINAFKKAKKKNVKFKPGDFFAFKIDRSIYGFGRVLLDIDDLKKKNLVPKDHGLGFIMTKPVLVTMFAYISTNKHTDISELAKTAALPSDYMMDNLLFYGEYEVIGHKNLTTDELDFPMSYGRHINSSKYTVFLQWGLIHRELSATTFNKYLTDDNPLVEEGNPSRKVHNPYGYYSIGFRPHLDGNDIKDTIESNGKYDYDKNIKFKSCFDLRSPRNKDIRNELMATFGLDPAKNYNENCEITKTIRPGELLKRIS